MATNPTVSELRKAAEIFDQEIDAAVDAYMANPQGDSFRFTSGHQIDVADAVQAYPLAVEALDDSNRTQKFKWMMVRTAILLAHRVKG